MEQARSPARAWWIAGAAMLLGCAAQNPAAELNEVSELSARIEHVRASAELARERVDAAVKALQSIARFDFEDDATAAFASFVATVDSSAEQVEALRASVESMQDAAEPLFERWQKNLDSFSSAEIRRHSEQRQSETRERFEAIVTAAANAHAAYDAFNRTLRDHVAYLKFDFNAASLSVIQGEVSALAERAAVLNGQFTACQDAARAYVDAASAPRAGAASRESRGGS